MKGIVHWYGYICDSLAPFILSSKRTAIYTWFLGIQWGIQQFEQYPNQEGLHWPLNELRNLQHENVESPLGEARGYTTKGTKSVQFRLSHNGFCPRLRYDVNYIICRLNDIVARHFQLRFILTWVWADYWDKFLLWRKKWLRPSNVSINSNRGLNVIIVARHFQLRFLFRSGLTETNSTYKWLRPAIPINSNRGLNVFVARHFQLRFLFESGLTDTNSYYGERSDYAQVCVSTVIEGWTLHIAARHFQLRFLFLGLGWLRPILIIAKEVITSIYLGSINK
jgi:hypothetical protein